MFKKHRHKNPVIQGYSGLLWSTYQPTGDCSHLKADVSIIHLIWVDNHTCDVTKWYIFLKACNGLPTSDLLLKLG